MEFWAGLLIGLLIGANVGLFVACLFGHRRRDKPEIVIENDLGSGEFVRWAAEQREKAL